MPKNTGTNWRHSVIVHAVLYWFGFWLFADIYRIKIIQIVVRLSVPLQVYEVLHVIIVRKGVVKCFRNLMKYVLFSGIKIAWFRVRELAMHFWHL
jgi:hypothetical protein